ncbi:hypothetical protein MMC18_001284 [Xylographa bjoerkii]|nr:hypothetical protein [Xylographa bjoerkii]
MPHFDQTISNSRRTRSTSDPNTTIPGTVNAVQHATTKHRKTGSAPPMAMNALKTANPTFEHAHNAAYSSRRGADTSVTGGVLTSRSASSSSLISRSDTLVDLSDAGYTTTVEATIASVAECRLRFKEEFGLSDRVEELKNTKAEDKPSSASTGHTSSPPVTKLQKSLTSVKNVKTKDRKMSRRDNGRKFNLGYRNLYTGGNTSDSTSSTIMEGGVSRKAMLGGPSVASGIVGCLMM